MKPTLVLAAALAFVAAPPLAAAPHGCGADIRVGMARKLGLSDAQRVQVRDAQRAFRDDNRSLFESQRATRLRFREAKRSGDTAAMQSLQALMVSQRAEMQRRHDALDQRVAAVLTEEQRARWEGIRAAREARRAERDRQKE